MNEKQKKNTIIGILLAIILFTVIGDKKLKPSVEVGQGSFGDFGTDGVFTDEPPYEPIDKKMDGFAAKDNLGNPKFDVNSNLKPLYNNVVENDGCGC